MNEILEVAFGYAPARCRGALKALWALDARLGQVVATTTEPMIGQMRLTWWHARLTELDAGGVPDEPVLKALADVIRHHDVTGAMLADLVEGWEALLEPLPLSDEALSAFADKRGDLLFALSARIVGVPVQVGLGAGWVLIDFAMHCSDAVTRARSQEKARQIFSDVRIKGPKSLRILSRLAKAKASGPVDKIPMPVSRWAMLRAVLP